MERWKSKSIGFMIGYLNRAAHKYFTSRFSQYGLNIGNIFILKRLYMKDGLKQHEICDNLHLDKAGVARNMNKLIESGFIRKDVDPADKRANRIHLTSKAKDFKLEFDTIFRSWSDKLTEGFDPVEQEEVKKNLLRMIANLGEQ
ncbi:MAG: winged helix-turn-helix transcriptional regulator [Candidatus Cloacimonetes bacterium]|nr:winged helix-turn-helix transcriptional regulator [Candidatus Cloacimonadota bacterium]